MYSGCNKRKLASLAVFCFMYVMNECFYFSANVCVDSMVLLNYYEKMNDGIQPEALSG